MKNKSIAGERLKYILISSIGIIVSLLLMKKFYMFTLAFYPEAIFLPYKQPYLQPGWRETTILLGTIGVTLTSILTFLLFFITKKYLKNIALSSITISVIIYGSFYMIHPNYNYYYHPYLFGYMTWDGKYIGNIDRYFEVIERYGFDGDSYRPFKTLDDAIQGLEFAKEKRTDSMDICLEI